MRLLTCVICAYNEVVVELLEYCKLWKILCRVESTWTSGQVASWTNLNGYVLSHDLLAFLRCQEDAVTQTIGIEVNHGSGLSHLFLYFSAMKRNFKSSLSPETL